MPNSKPSLIGRNDTILGVCEAIGQDFGFHPNWLRLVLAGLFYFNPAAVIGTYLGLGAIVAFTRWIAPDKVEIETPALSVVSSSQPREDAEPVVLAA